jgi:hypothetical protein
MALTVAAEGALAGRAGNNLRSRGTDGGGGRRGRGAKVPLRLDGARRVIRWRKRVDLRGAGVLLRGRTGVD